jgi:predicted DNA-binding transcriptional regulator YafY
VSGATERLSRLLALVPYLLARQGVPIAQAAQEFGISERQLVKDLELIFVCGLPGHLPDDLIEASWEGGRVHVGNAEAIARPLKLGVDEAVTLLVGLRMLAGVPGLQDRDAVDRATAKLERAAGDAARPSEQVSVEVEAEESVLATCRDALAGERRLHLSYYVPTRDEVTERDVDPMRVLLADGRAYLEGWCHRVEGVRLFRLDRVVALQLLDTPATVPPQARPRDLEDGLFRPSPEDEVVTLELQPAGRWVADYYPHETPEELPGGALRIRLRTPDARWVARLALRLGGTGRVVDPPELAATVQAEARAALAAYAADAPG